MDLKINSTLTNGMNDFIRDANKVNMGGFIFGALDRGFTVSIPGAVVVKYGKWKAITHVTMTANKVNFFYGSGKY